MSTETLRPTGRAWLPADHRLAGWAAGAAVTLALAAAYAPNLRGLAAKWADDPNYSHGYLVAPIALLILWQRRDDLEAGRMRPNAAGWLALVGLLGLRSWLFERNEQWAESATIPLVGAALALALGGWHLLRWAAPALAFLWLMLPLPPTVNIVLAGPLQGLATWGSTLVLQAMGQPVLSEGNVILVGPDRLNVAEACNGLSMLLSFVTLITATVILLRSRPAWERAVLLLSTVPIALLSNVLRIAIIALCYRALGAELGHRIGHDWGGYMMMPIALALVLVELKLLRWLVIEERVPTRPVLVVPPSYAPRANAKRKAPGAPAADDGPLGPAGDYPAGPVD